MQLWTKSVNYSKKRAYSTEVIQVMQDQSKKAIAHLAHLPMTRAIEHGDQTH